MAQAIQGFANGIRITQRQGEPDFIQRLAGQLLQISFIHSSEMMRDIVSCPLNLP